MRAKITKKRNYNKNNKTTKSKIRTTSIEEPKPTDRLAAYKMSALNTNDWYEILDIRYYEHLQDIYDISWSDVFDKSGGNLLETQVKISDLSLKQVINKNKTEKKDSKSNIEYENPLIDKGDKLFNEIIPSKNQVLYSLTLYHTTNTLLIQGNKKVIWVEKEFPILKSVLKYKNENKSSTIEAYQQILEVDIVIQKQDVISQEEKTDNTILIDKNNDKKISDIVKDLVQNIIDTVEREESERLKNSIVENHKVEKLYNCNTSTQTKIKPTTIMIEMQDLSPTTPNKIITPAKRMKSPKNKINNKPQAKRGTHDKISENTVSIEMYENLKTTVNKTDKVITTFEKRYTEDWFLLA